MDPQATPPVSPEPLQAASALPIAQPLTAPQSMSASLGQGWQLFKYTFRVLHKYPVMLVPLFLVWITIAAFVLAARYVDLSLWLILVIFFAIVYALTLSCLMLLELIQQAETGHSLSLGKALMAVISKDAVKALPIALVWGAIWLVLSILRALASRARRSNRATPSMADAAGTLSGMNSPFSWIGLGLDMLEKLLRMVVFAMLPAIAWEDAGPWAAAVKGSQVVRRHPAQFLSNYGLTMTAAVIMAIPLMVVGEIGRNATLPSWVWLAVIVYSGLVFTLNLYLEEMSVALLYMWHMKWESQGAVGDLSSVAPPDLLSDTVYLETDGSANAMLDA